MKKIICYTGLLAALVVCSVTTHAQDVQMRAGYNTGMPMGAFKDFMGKNSFRGYFGEITYPIAEQWKIGLGVQFNDYYEKLPRQVYETKDGTISAVVTNSIQTTPVLARGAYELTKDHLVRPYVGLGVGFNVIGFNQYLGEFNSSKSLFKPAASAEAGVNIPFNKITRSTGINVGVHYNYMPLNYNGVDNLNNWGAHLGIFFPLG